ncbi:MAG TPA: aspartyl protease family protein [Pyrinomonadaceae bacterium]|jgi:hypothetical protein|nr:aspartyl protease family protein [Pyrinomonadaceae bacterium]
MNRKTLLAFFLILFLLATATPHPVQKSSQPAATPATVSIPFELVIRHIVVGVMIDNSRPLSFVFDTGDKVAIVDSDLAKDLGLKLEGQINVGGTGSDFLRGSFVKESTWTLPGVAGFSQPVMLALPLRRLAARFGHDFDGIIGSDFIKRYVVEVDYAARKLVLHDKDKFSYSGPGESIPIEFDHQGHPLIEAEIIPLGGASIKRRFVLDLGSGGGLALHSPFVTEHQLLSPTLKTIRAIGAGGAGGQSVGRIGRISELKIGKFRIASPTVLFSEDKAGAFANESLAGNIGQQVASKFKLYLDYEHARIILEPAATFNEPFAKASSGLALMGEGVGYSTLRVIDVLENSPASEVGLQKDDVITKVNDKLASELTITKLSEMFERSVPYKLTIQRGDRTLQVTLRPRKLV